MTTFIDNSLVEVQAINTQVKWLDICSRHLHPLWDTPLVDINCDTVSTESRRVTHF